jgi:hypothetical protein
MQRLDHVVMKLTRLIAGLAPADEDGLITVWDLMTAARIRTIDTEDHELRCLGFSRDEGTLAAAGMRRTIRLWDPMTGRELLKLECRKTQINRVDCSAFWLKSAGECRLDRPMHPGSNLAGSRESACLSPSTRGQCPLSIASVSSDRSGAPW